MDVLERRVEGDRLAGLRRIAATTSATSILSSARRIWAIDCSPRRSINSTIPLAAKAPWSEILRCWADFDGHLVAAMEAGAGQDKRRETNAADARAAAVRRFHLAGEEVHRRRADEAGDEQVAGA